MDFVVFFTVEFLIFVVGALAFGYCLLSCTSIYDSRNYQFACYLCKEMVWAKSWDRHRAECARQNEWYIDALPESPQVRHSIVEGETLRQNLNVSSGLNAISYL